MTNSDEENPLASLFGDTAPLSEDRRARIEASLRVQHGAAHARPRGSGVPRWAFAVPAMILLLVIATVALVVRDEGTVAALEVRDADNVTITLPDGSVVQDPADGFVLDEGTVVRVGESGSITIDEVRLGAGAVVTVRDGRLVTDVVVTQASLPDHLNDPAPPLSVPPTAPTNTEPSTTTTRPSDTTTTTASDRPPPTTTNRPGDVGPEEPPPAPTTSRVVDERPADGASRPAGVDLAVALRVRAGDGQIRVAWETIGVEADWTVHVIRTTDGSIPADPATATVLATGRNGDTSEPRADLPPDWVALRYRVVVTDPDGAVVASSVVQTLDPPHG